MDKRTINDEVVAENSPQLPSVLDEIVQAGARRMLIAALEAEVEAYIQAHKSERTKAGQARVVRHGKAKERKIQCGAGSIKVQAPRVKDKRPGRKFTSNILPPYLRRSPRLETAVPVLYLQGLSTGDFKPREERKENVVFEHLSRAFFEKAFQERFLVFEFDLAGT